MDESIILYYIYNNLILDSMLGQTAIPKSSKIFITKLK